jgi:alcohol dehydrogenase class IV
MEPAAMSLIRYVTRIHFADRVLEDALPEEMRTRGIMAPLIVTDEDTGEALARLIDCLPVGCRPGVMELNGNNEPADRIRLALDRPGAKDDTPDTRNRPHDATIGLGGVMALDLARIGADRPGGALPNMAVPTLPGCVGLGPLGAGQARGRRVQPMVGPVPDVVFCDPGLLQFASPQKLARAGMDALVHCLEALLSTTWNPPADGIAFDGLRRAGAWLERLVADPRDPEARREVLASALNGGLAAQKGFGAIHALSHAIEALAPDDAPHGSLHAALAGPVLAFNAPAVPERIDRKSVV